MPGTVVLLAGCNLAAVRGSGTLKVEPRPVPTFSQISIESAVDADIAIGPVAQVELSGDDNLLPLITTTVRDDELVISAPPNTSFRPTQHLKARIIVPAIHKLDVSGTSDLQLAGVDTEALEVSISGTSRMRLTDLHTNALRFSISGTGNLVLNDVDAGQLAVSLSGTAHLTGAGRGGRLDLDVIGTGHLELGQFPVDDAHVDCSGTGDIEVRVNRALEARVSGTADILYDGNPSVQSSISGTGHLRHR